MKILPSARKRGIDDADILHALEHLVTNYEIEEDRWLVIGPDRAGNLLELVVLSDAQVAIHAMPLTTTNEKFLP